MKVAVNAAVTFIAARHARFTFTPPASPSSGSVCANDVHRPTGVAVATNPHNPVSRDGTQSAQKLPSAEGCFRPVRAIKHFWGDSASGLNLHILRAL